MIINETLPFVIFKLGEQKYALPLSVVQRILRMVEITALPNAPNIILGVINVSGQVIPVAGLRSRLGLAERDVSLNDRIIIAHTHKRTVALVVDEVEGVLESHNEKMIQTEKILSGVKNIKGLIKTADGLVLIHDLNDFLSLDEEEVLNRALESQEAKE